MRLAARSLLSVALVICATSSSPQESLGASGEYMVVFGRNSANGISFDGRWDTAARPSRLSISLTNGRSNDIYVFDTLWTLNESSLVIPDVERIYRYVLKNKILLFVGAAPLPRQTTTAYRNIPFATLVKSGQTLHKTIDIAIPVTEYSVYFSGRNSGEKKETIQEAELRIQFVDARQNFKTDLAPFDTKAVKLSVPGVIASSEVISSSAPVAGLPALHRLGNFERPSF
jgi:hypothetical protein